MLKLNWLLAGEIFSFSVVIVACARSPVMSPTMTSTQVLRPTTSASTSVPAQVETQTPKPPLATASPVPVMTQTRTRKPTSPTATSVPTSTRTPTRIDIYNAPFLLDPPSGKSFSVRKDTTLRWKSDHELKSDEVFDVLVWPQNSKVQTSIGNTKEISFFIDFESWKYDSTPIGMFFWTVRIKRLNGVYLSGASQPFSFQVHDPNDVDPYP